MFVMSKNVQDKVLVVGQICSKITLKFKGI